MFKFVVLILFVSALGQDIFPPSPLRLLEVINSGRCLYPAPRPLNGYFVYRSNANDISVDIGIYKCNTCYSLLGSDHNACWQRRWIFAAPTCRRKDPCATSVAGPCMSNAECVSYGSGIYTCICRNGYSGNGKRSYYKNACFTYRGIKGIDGCLKDCDTTVLGNPSLLDSYPHDVKVEWTCKAGLQGSGTVRCSNGRWVGPLPNCLSLCAHPTRLDVDNADYWPKKENYVETDHVTWRCDIGYYGPETQSVCNSNGSWTGHVPICRRN
ncbi:C4b-binding protein-like [Clavelina lepadiformis]|uniref:C4b-binding protein-like n=1 Tax=Clavelina lepadiformis TaxID=159417 RepID=UPI00404324D0